MLRRSIWVVICLSWLAGRSFADQLGDEKGKAKQILKVVVSEIEKNYYDPTFHGENLKELQAKAAEMIDNAHSVGQVYTAIFGVVERLNDSHTMFLPPGRTHFPQFGFEAKAYGDKVYVTKIKKKGGAREAGLQVGDQILQVNGFEAERGSFDKMMLFFHVLQPVTELELLVVRGSEPPKKIVTKAFVKPEMRVFDAENDLNIWDLITDAESDEKESQKSAFIRAEENSGIGYFALHSFEVEPETATSWATLMGNAKGVIIDLRGNFGGSHDTLVALTNKFSAEPGVMGDVIGRKKTEPIKVKPSRGAYTVPMVILVDSQSASAAEMFARHFQRLKRAVVIGDRTRGSGAGAIFLRADRHRPLRPVRRAGVHLKGALSRQRESRGERRDSRPDVHPQWRRLTRASRSVLLARAEVLVEATGHQRQGFEGTSGCRDGRVLTEIHQTGAVCTASYRT